MSERRAAELAGLIASEEVADRLFAPSASGTPEDGNGVPAVSRPIAALVATARIPDGCTATADPEFLSAMVAAVSAGSIVRRRRASTARRLIASKVAVGATLMMGAATAAALTGELPPPAQAAVEHVVSYMGFDLPGADDDPQPANPVPAPETPPPSHRTIATSDGASGDSNAGSAGGPTGAVVDLTTTNTPEAGPSPSTGQTSTSPAPPSTDQLPTADTPHDGRTGAAVGVGAPPDISAPVPGPGEDRGPSVSGPSPGPPESDPSPEVSGRVPPVR